MKKLFFIIIFNLVFSSLCFADDELIHEWNKQAFALMQTGNISSPVNKSALYYLARIEKVSPHHEKAKQLRLHIISAYADLASNNDNANNKKLLQAIASDLEKYSESERLDESTSSARLQRFLKLNYPSINTEKMAVLESDYIAKAQTNDVLAVKEEENNEIAQEEPNQETITDTQAEQEKAIETKTEEEEKVVEKLQNKPNPNIAVWQQKAQQRINEARLSLPANDNALYYLSLIEKEDINSNEATTLRDKIAARYIGLGKYAITQNKIEKGNKWLGIGEHIQTLTTTQNFTSTLDSVKQFNTGVSPKSEIKTEKIVKSEQTKKTNNQLLSIPEQKPQSSLISQTLEISIDNSEWINPFEKKRRKNTKKKVELNINENITPGKNKIITEKTETVVEKNPETNINTASTLSPAKQTLIKKLYEQAQVDINNDRLMKPANKNAYSKLLKIEEVDKNNEIAVQLRNDIYSAYTSLIETAISAGLTDKATLWLDNAEQILPGEDKTIELREKINSNVN